MVTESVRVEDPENLLAREAALRSKTGPLRMRDAAEALGLPEAALLEARRATGAATRLRRPPAPEGFGALIARLPAAGRLMALTRNAACVHEKRGAYAVPEFHGATGQVLGAIDLRLFLGHWAYGYQFVDETARGPRASLQFFDAAGVAIHKVFPTDESDDEAFCALVAEFADFDADQALFLPPPVREGERPDAAIDVAGLRAAWDRLEHSHAFHGLLRDFGVSRLQALRLGGAERARPVPAEVARHLLTRVAAQALPVMVFVGNPGCVQIHSGPIERVETVGPWLNVLDPDFNLHLREDRVASAWIVRKPSVRGDIHALELFDGSGDCICQVFGARAPGEGERSDWRELLAGLSVPVE